MTERPGRGELAPRLLSQGAAIMWQVIGYKVTGCAPGEGLTQPKLYALCNTSTEAERLANRAIADGWSSVTWQAIYGKAD